MFILVNSFGANRFVVNSRRVNSLRVNSLRANRAGLDNVSFVPAPGAAGVLGVLLIGPASRRRR